MTRTALFATATFAALALASGVHAQTLVVNNNDVVTVSGAGTVGTLLGVPVANTTKTYISATLYGSGAFTLGTGGTIDTTNSSYFYGLNATGSGPITITGGIIATGGEGPGIEISGSSSIAISGGTFSAGQYGEAISASSSGSMTISGGTFTNGNGGDGVYADNSGPTTISGGAFSGGLYGLFAGGSGSVTITGGTFTSDANENGAGLLAYGSGPVDLYGAFNGLTLGQTKTLGYGNGSFIGTLEFNTAPQTFTYVNANTIRLHDVALAAAPEPSQFAALAIGLLGLGVLVIKARKRQAL